MKKIISFIVLTIMLVGCGRSTPKLVQNKYMNDADAPQTGFGRTVWIASADMGDKRTDVLDRVFGNNFLRTVTQDEMYKSGFEVVERAEMDKVMEEHLFSQHMANTRLESNFIPARYTVSMKLINIESTVGGVFIPILYINADTNIETSVEVKLIDNVTGITKTMAGNATVVINTQNLLLFFGDLATPTYAGIEYSVRSAIRDALSKF